MKGRLAAIALALWPTAAQACVGCVTANERNRMAFLITTIVLSLLPLAMIGAGVLALRRRLRGEFEDRDAWAPPPAASPR
jgi:hypothetical protein